MSIRNNLARHNRTKLFIDNFLVYGLGGVISKIVPFIMVPIVTRLMPNSSYYGISDLSNTLVSFGSALAIMGMYDAMFRLFFDKDDLEYKKSICSTALSFTISTSLVIFAMMVLFRRQIASFFFADNNYAYLVYISAMATLVGATNNIVSAPTRMQNQRKIFIITNTLSPIISYSISIPLLLRGFYVIALPLAGVISGLSMEIIFGCLNHKWFQFKFFNRKLLKELLKLAVPLLPNVLIYWVFNSSDRIMITNILGTHASGIYAVGAKLGTASQLIYTAFAGGWQYFAFSTMKDKDQVKSNSLVFEYLGAISFVCGILICVFSYPIYKIFFTGEYQRGYIIAPYLFFAPLVQMLEQVIGNQFLVIKKAWPTMLILSSGAVINIGLNVLLIPLIGIEGAAIATLLGYVACVVVCSTVLLSIDLLVIDKRFYLSVLITLVFVICWRLLFPQNIVIGLPAAIVACILIGRLYKNELNAINTRIVHRKQ